MVSPYSRQRAVWLMWVAGAIAFAGLLVLAGVRAQDARASGGPGLAPLQTHDILGRPRRYLTQTVAVRGRIARVWGNRVLALRDHTVRAGLMIFLGDDSLQSQVYLREGEEVEVIGTVRVLTREEAQALERQFGANLHRDDLRATYALHPYILAQKVKPATH